jgi:hypothetical protein
VENIYIICEKNDMRKGIDGLATLVQDVFELDPYSNPIAGVKTDTNVYIFGKNALAKAAEYTLNRANGLKVFLNDGNIEIDNNPAESPIAQCF